MTLCSSSPVAGSQSLTMNLRIAAMLVTHSSQVIGHQQDHVDGGGHIVMHGGSEHLRHHLPTLTKLQLRLSPEVGQPEYLCNQIDARVQETHAWYIQQYILSQTQWAQLVGLTCIRVPSWVVATQAQDFSRLEMETARLLTRKLSMSRNQGWN